MKHFVTNTYEKYWYAARVQVNWFDDETPLQGDAPQGFAQGDVIAGRISLPGKKPGNPKQRQDAEWTRVRICGGYKSEQDARRATQKSG